MPLHVLSSSLHLLFCLALFRKGFQSTVNGKRAPSRCARRKGGQPSWPHSKRNNCYLRRGKKTVSRDLHHTAIISVMFNVSNWMLILIVQKGTRPLIFQPWFGYIDFHGRKSRWPHHNKSLLYLTISLLACGHPFQFKTVWKYLRFLISLFNERRPWVSYFKHSAPGMQLFRRSAVYAF